uniref:Uncharacterized protein n=1 Tax=Arundo donax TaxID=35708 RepID=A0A0A8YGR9_ARUDO
MQGSPQSFLSPFGFADGPLV